MVEFNESLLVVDDDLAILRTYERIFSETKYKLLTADSAEKGLQILEDQQVFLILADYFMPEMNGIEFKWEITNRNMDVPFVLVTAYGDKDAAVTAMRSGIDDLIDKPFKPNKLKELVDKYYAKREETLEQEQQELAVLRETFIEETEQLLRDADNLVISLEEADADSRDVNELFRRMHTIKGSGAALPNTENLVKICHSFENALTALKKKKLVVTQGLIECFLRTLDVIKIYVGKIKDNSEDYPSIDECLGYLDAFLKTANMTSETKEKFDFGVEDKQVKTMEVIDEGVMVSTQKLDRFMEFAGELVAMKNMFEGFIKQKNMNEEQKNRGLIELQKTLSKISDGVQNRIMEIRKVSLKSVFTKYRRIVRNTANNLDKQIRLEIQGDKLEVDKNIASALDASMVHAIRNSCDHGIETTEQRKAENKTPIGRVEIKARQLAGNIIITLEDDGRGLNREKIIEKAVRQNIVKALEADSLSDEQVYQLIFYPGFSTKTVVSETSGRGVGMDVVKEEIEKVGGTVSVSSKEGEGTCLEFKIPIPKTVIVEHSIVAESKENLLVVPLTNISDIKPLERKDLTFVRSAWTLQYLDKTIPLARYDQYIMQGYDDNPDIEVEDDEMVIIVNFKDSMIGLRVDRIVDQLEAVIRPFCNVVGKLTGFRGLSVLSDSRISYVASAEELVKSANRRVKKEDKAA